MKLFSPTFLARHQLKLLFLVIWLHISALDLVVVTRHGVEFLWQANYQPLTLVVHALIALATVGVFSCIKPSPAISLNKQSE